jgi:transposase-like protein
MVAMKGFKRYSEAFKLSVIREIADGKWSGPAEASAAYRITGSMTVGHWMEEYGQGHLLNRVTRVEMKDEKTELKRLKAEVHKLKEALADAHIDLKLSEAFFAIVCEEHGTDPADAKKKLAGKLGTESADRRRGLGS